MPNLEPPRLLVALFVSVVVLVVFAACGASKDGGFGAPAPNSATEPTPVVTGASTQYQEPSASRADSRADSQPTEIATPGDEAVSQLASPEATVVPEPVATLTSTPEPVAAPTAVPEPIAASTPTPAPEPVLTEEPAPALEPLPIAEPTPALEPVPMAEPTPAPTLEPTPAPALLSTVDRFGFVLKLDRGADVKTTGWTAAEPDADQGTLSFTAGGVNTVLIWGPQQQRSPLTFLADTYNILRGSQPELTFDPISDGEIAVSGGPGVYGGFKTIDLSGTTVGGGLIGTWVCTEPETAYRLTLTGAEATVVQLRFDRLVDQFACTS